jgi:AraC-like DNA-binding protein
MMEDVYRERPSVLPGIVVWANTPSAGTSTVLPDGCTDLLFDGERLLIAGPDTVAHQVDVSANAYAGVRTPSGVGPSLWGVPGCDIVNRRVDLYDIWPRPTVDQMTERVATGADPGAELERIVAACRRERPPDRIMVDIAAHLAAGVSVADVASRAGLSDRQLRRRSLFAYGYGAKTLSRILRLSAALGQARRGCDFARTAHDCGYADQAHFAREVKCFTGQTPTRLLADPSR